jgi:6-phospho-beta-glucosidase
MKKGIKIVTIGGGSSYTPELVEGFILRYDQLPVKELWLVDVEEGKEKLEIVSKLAQRMVEKAGVDMKIIPTLDRKLALKDADFVTTQMRVGLLDARVKDERIPNSFGLIGQETNGAGGMFKALRTIPVILEIVKEIEELCPKAWMINFTNPAGMVTEAIIRHTNFKNVIGLCNLPVGMIAGFANLLEVDPSRIRMEIQGTNHNIFATDVFLDGESVFDQVLDLYIKNNENATMRNIEALEYSSDLIRGLNAIPCAYHNYYFFTKEQLEMQLKEYEQGRVRGEVVKKVESELFELYKDVNLAVKPKQLEQRGGALYSDAACNLICSLYNDTGDIQYVDIANNGAITNLPNDSAVEVACVITKDGPKPLALGNLKAPINGMIQTLKTFEYLTIEAAVKGDRSAAIAALNINPLVTSDKVANDVFDALLEAHQDYLPQFK